MTVPLPDVRGRLSILQHHVRNITIADGVNLQQVARGTPGFSGAQLENLVNQAAVRASRQGESTVNLDHIEWAKDKILMGAERLSAVVTPESRKNTAFHEGSWRCERDRKVWTLADIRTHQLDMHSWPCTRRALCHYIASLVCPLFRCHSTSISD